MRAYLLDPKRKQRIERISCVDTLQAKRYDDPDLSCGDHCRQKNMWTYAFWRSPIPWAMPQSGLAADGRLVPMFTVVKARMLGADCTATRIWPSTCGGRKAGRRGERHSRTFSALTSIPSLSPSSLDKRKINLTVRLLISGSDPGYITRPRCYESIRGQEKALDDYALFLRIMRYFARSRSKKWDR